VCGICGVLSNNREQVEPAVRRMMSAMVHRGPDDEGYEQLPLGDGDQGPVAGFGFRRLAILDRTSAGHQPMYNTATGDCLIFNGEIYNFKSLRAELQLRGILFRGKSDSEVLLQALSTWGEAALEKLQGMYAFAFYEAKTRRILLARDPLGIKPLYFAALPDRFVFASEIRAVRASGLVAEDHDIRGIATMLAYGAVQSPFTIYERIRSFPAGGMQWLDEGVVAGRPLPAVRRFWNFVPQPFMGVDPRTASATVQRMLRESVLRHLVADVPVGVFLSAGIDSTIIAACAREYTPQVTAFTVGFQPISAEDETEPARRTAAALGIRHVTVDVDAKTLPESWQRWVSGMDSPSIDGFNTFLVSQRLAEESVVVGLSGLGADELFGGYSAFTRSPRWSRILGTLAMVPPTMKASLVRRIMAASGQVSAAEKAADLVAGCTSVSGITSALRRAVSNSSLARLGLPPSLVGLSADYLGEGQHRLDPMMDGDRFNTISRLELTRYMGDTLLRDTDANSMQHSLEVRVPFLDRPLIDYVSSLPGTLKTNGRDSSKHLLRRAFEGLLPVEIARRPKTGFTLPIGAWMAGPMRDECEAAIRRLEKVAFIESAEVRRVWESFLQSRRAIHWSRPLAFVVLGSAMK
jgi:asparagine synthase (glutamine-hydrolysing)